MGKELILRALGFDKEMDLVAKSRCPFCGVSVDENSFKDELSKKEYRISGICQGCQDKFFEGGDEDVD